MYSIGAVILAILVIKFFPRRCKAEFVKGIRSSPNLVIFLIMFCLFSESFHAVKHLRSTTKFELRLPRAFKIEVSCDLRPVDRLYRPYLLEKEGEFFLDFYGELSSEKTFWRKGRVVYKEGHVLLECDPTWPFGKIILLEE